MQYKLILLKFSTNVAYINIKSTHLRIKMRIISPKLSNSSFNCNIYIDAVRKHKCAIIVDVGTFYR